MQHSNWVPSPMTNESIRFRKGLYLSSIAVLFWGILPIALKLSSLFIDAINLTWARFLTALLVSLLAQLFLGNLTQFSSLTLKDWGKLILAASCLILNYISFVWCLEYLSPGSAQLNFQVAPFFLAIGGVLLFKEKISWQQWACFVSLAVGMLLFFYPSLLDFQSGGRSIVTGIMIVQFSAFMWAIYALIQKSMIQNLSPANIMLFIYGLGMLLMLPFTDLTVFTRLDFEQWMVISFCSINTIIAYGCFSQAMIYWPTVQVSAMISLTPIASLAATSLCIALLWWPETIKANKIDLISGLGVLLVVVSAASVQFFRHKPLT